MIQSLDQKTKRELVEIVKIQLEEYQQLTKQFEYVVELYEWRIKQAEEALEGLKQVRGAVDRRKQIEGLTKPVEWN